MDGASWSCTGLDGSYWFPAAAMTLLFHTEHDLQENPPGRPIFSIWIELNWFYLKRKGYTKGNPMNMLPLYEPKKSKDIHNYKVQTLQKIKIWSASNWNWSWLYTKVTSRLFPLPSPPLQDLAFALPLVAIFVVVVIIFIVSACVVYRARYGYFCCWKPVSLSSQFASQERNTYVPRAMSHALQ